MSAYETSVQIDHFAGLNESGDGYNLSVRYAREMENVDVSGGGFRPMREGITVPQSLTHPIGTLAFLHRRYGASTGTLLVAVSDGKVYTKTLDGSDSWVQRHSGLNDYDCDWVTYEVNYPAYDATSTYGVGDRCVHDNSGGVAKNWICGVDINTAEAWDADNWTEIGDAAPVDVLLFTNATDGMFCLYGDTLDVVAVTTPENFGVLARYNERIWGAGIPGNPDKLIYSAPYDPFDWEANATIPEDGAGDILQPTWDGDIFVSLKQYGSDLLAVKRNSIWRIYGTNPGEFSMQRQYGGGTIEENTFAVYNNYGYMLGEYGLMRYDGTGAYPFNQEAVHILMRERASRTLDEGRYPAYREKKYFPNDRCKHNGAYYRCRENNLSDMQATSVTAALLTTTPVTCSNLTTFMAAAKEYYKDVPTTGSFSFLMAYNRTREKWYIVSATLAPEYFDLADFGFSSVTIPETGAVTISVTATVTTPWVAARWVAIDPRPLNTACAGMWNTTYCLALPLDGSDRCNAILQYDTVTGAFSLRTGVTVDAFLQVNERLFYTSADYPGQVFEMDDTHGEVRNTRWVSGFQDLGVKSSVKSDFLVYMMVDAPGPTDFWVGIRTEKKLKRKLVRVKPGKLTRVRIPNHGREFRLEMDSITTVPFTIAGGIKIDLELDPD